MSPLSLCGVLVKTREMKGLPLDTQMVLVSLQSYTAVSKRKKRQWRLWHDTWGTFVNQVRLSYGSMILLLCGGSTFIVLREEIKENGLALESFKRFELYAAKTFLAARIIHSPRLSKTSTFKKTQWHSEHFSCQQTTIRWVLPHD